MRDQPREVMHEPMHEATRAPRTVVQVRAEVTRDHAAAPAGAVGDEGEWDGTIVAVIVPADLEAAPRVRVLWEMLRWLVAERPSVLAGLPRGVVSLEVVDAVATDQAGLPRAGQGVYGDGTVRGTMRFFERGARGPDLRRFADRFGGLLAYGGAHRDADAFRDGGLLAQALEVLAMVQSFYARFGRTPAGALGAAGVDPRALPGLLAEFRAWMHDLTEGQAERWGETTAAVRAFADARPELFTDPGLLRRAPGARRTGRGAPV